MKFYAIPAVGISHLQQNKLRSGLSILGILIGIASVLCMMAIGDGAKQLIAEDIEKLGGANQVQFTIRTFTRHRGRRYPTTERYTLADADADAIERECPDVIRVLPQNGRLPRWVNTRHGTQTRADIDGVTASYAIGLRWEVGYGRFLSENDIEKALQVCVLGANVATELFGETFPLGQEVRIPIGRKMVVRCRVVGVMTPKGNQLSGIRSLDNSVYVPLTTHQQRIYKNRYVKRLIIFFQKGANVYRVIEDVKSVLRERHQGTDNFIAYWILKLNIKRLERIEKMIKIALGGISGFSLFVSGISIMNMCLVSVGEKMREIGLRKSVGARRIDIFWQFLTESISLCFCGAFLGIFFGWFAAHGMARLAVRIVPIVPAWPVVLSILFSIFMGVVFGIYPALRAAWMTPIDALRCDT